MQTKLGGRADIMEKIIPTNFNVGCRRPTVRCFGRSMESKLILTLILKPGNGFLEALVSDKVTTFLESIGEVTPSGFKDSQGNEHEADVIICATG